MGLVDYFNKWIVEHGSAVVQEKQIAFLRDQLDAADKKISEFESENAILKDKFENAGSKLAELIRENENLTLEVTKFKTQEKTPPEVLEKLAKVAWNATT